MLLAPIPNMVDDVGEDVPSAANAAWMNERVRLCMNLFHPFLQLNLYHNVLHDHPPN